MTYDLWPKVKVWTNPGGYSRINYSNAFSGMSDRPPFTVTPAILGLVADIGELVGGLEASLPPERQLLLRRANQIRTIQGSLAIEGNILSLDQVTGVIAGKRVLGSTRKVQEVRGAVAAYERMGKWDPAARDDLLVAHGVLMAAMHEDAMKLRSGRPGRFPAHPVSNHAARLDLIPSGAL